MKRDPLLQAFAEATEPSPEAAQRVQIRVEQVLAVPPPQRRRWKMWLLGMGAPLAAAGVLLAVLMPLPRPRYALDPLGPGILDHRAYAASPHPPTFDEGSVVRVVARPVTDVPNPRQHWRSELWGTDPRGSTRRLERDLAISSVGTFSTEAVASNWFGVEGRWRLHLLIGPRSSRPYQPKDLGSDDIIRLDVDLIYRPTSAQKEEY